MYPAGAKFRELYERAQLSPLTLCGIPALERCTREIQSVTCSLTMAQDHTHDVVNNYPRSLGAKACWTCCTETGEIAAAVLVRDTKSANYAHAAEQLLRRNDFKPKIMYADTWPHLDKFWRLLLGVNCKGRLGLFHFMTRIVKTLRDNHIDYRKAIWELKRALYCYEALGYERLMTALKEGLMAKDGHKYTDEEITELQHSSKFKERYDKWLRKIIYKPPQLVKNLEKWFIQFKVRHSLGKEEGQGKVDPVSLKTPIYSGNKGRNNQRFTYL